MTACIARSWWNIDWLWRPSPNQAQGDAFVLLPSKLPETQLLSFWVLFVVVICLFQSVKPAPLSMMRNCECMSSLEEVACGLALWSSDKNMFSEIQPNRPNFHTKIWNERRRKEKTGGYRSSYTCKMGKGERGICILSLEYYILSCLMPNIQI